MSKRVTRKQVPGSWARAWDHELKTQTEVGIPQSDKNNHHVTRL